MKKAALLGSYVGTSALACWAATLGGPRVTPYVAFALISATMVLKDRLQEEHGAASAAAGVVGAAFATLLVPQSERIAVAGCIAALASGLVDVWVLQKTRSRFLSDATSATLDSLLFLGLAFGGGPVVLQTLLKVIGAQAWRRQALAGTGVTSWGPLFRQVISGYLTRYGVRVGSVQVALHKFIAPDPMPDLHSHAWDGALFFVLRGGYEEVTLGGGRVVRWVNFVAHSSFHRISRLHRAPTWTLGLIVGDRFDWGFYDDKRGYRSWQSVLREG